MKKTVFTIIGWLVSACLLILLATKLDFAAIWAGLLKASWRWLILGAIINLLVIALKALRWKWLMEPKAPLSYKNVLKASVIGFAGNNVLPARGGDWIKIYLLDKWSGAGITPLASVVGLDKIFDGLAILILFGFLSFHSTFPVWVQRGTTIVSILMAVSLFLCVLLLIHHRRNPKDHEKKLGRLSLLAKKFGSGMDALTSKRLVAITFINSIAICLLQVGTLWCSQIAFGLNSPVWMPALVFVAINLAIIIPSAPSGVGPFEVAAVLAYTWLGVKTEMAFNIALMYHLVQVLPVTIAGFIFYLTQNSEIKGLKKSMSETPSFGETI